MKQAFRAALIGIAFASTNITFAQAQDKQTIARITPSYLNFLKQTYSTPAGQDIIRSTSSGGIANQAFASIAVGIREGRFDNISTRDQYNLLGCHLQDLSAFSGSLAQQYANNPNLPQIKAPFFAKISQDAQQASNDLTSIGYYQNCQQVRADYATYLLGRPLR